MQKYYITDGSNYVKQIKGKFITVNSHVLATEFPKREAEKILCCNLGKNYDSYYLEGIEDFKRTTRDQISTDTVGEKELILQKGDGTASEARLLSLESYVKVLMQAEPISGNDLDGLKTEIESSISFYDLCLSDIYHWVILHKPPAHVMAKVYCMLREILQNRRRVKEDLGFVMVLIDAEKSGQSHAETKKKLLGRVYDDYVPRTRVWKELEALAGAKEAV